MNPTGWLGCVSLGSALLAIGAACGGARDLGPVALYDGAWVEDDGAIEGTLVLVGNCLYIETRPVAGEPTVHTLPAFGKDGSSWDAEEASVRIPGAVYRVGDSVHMGGGESADPADITWERPPDASCDTSMVWLVARP